MTAKILAVLANPMTWLFLTAFVGPELIRLVLSGEAFGVQFFTRLGNGPAADLTALVGDGAQGIIRAISSGKSYEEALSNAKASVLALWANQRGRALADVEEEIGMLVEGRLRIRSSSIPVVAQAPGGAVVELPKGFARTGLLLAILGASGLVLGAFPALGQAAAPVVDQAEQNAPAPVVAPSNPTAPARGVSAQVPQLPAYTFSLLGSALRFPWGGGTPVEVSPGVGVQLQWNVPFNVTLPLLGSVPLLSLGGAVTGTVAPSPAATSYQLSIGPLLTVIHSLGIGLMVDLAAGGSGGVTGILPGKVGLANVAGLLVYSAQLGAAAELSVAPPAP